MAHNGGRSQTNFWFREYSGTFPFINHLKMAYALTGNAEVIDPDQLDANGYPLTLVEPLYLLCDIPTASEYTGTWVLDWLGTGTLSIGTDITPIAVSPGSLSGTDGFYKFTNNETTIGSGVNFKVTITVTSGSDHIRQLRLYRLDQASNMAAGETWNPVFVNKLIAAKIGVLRFMDWQSTNTGNLVRWADRRPTTYITYGGSHWKLGLWGGDTDGSGNAYTAPGPVGFSLTDRVQVFVRFNRDGTGLSGYTMNIATTGAKRMVFAGGATVLSSPGSTNDFFGGGAPTNTCLGCLTYDAGLDQWLLQSGGNTNRGIDDGVPPELFVDLCNRVGAHPWVCIPMHALDTRDTYATQLATYFRDNLDPGLVPRYEPGNEIWNFSQIITAFAINKSYIYWGDFSGGDTIKAPNEWYGKVLSQTGQDISAVYSADRSKYQMILGVWQAWVHDPPHAFGSRYTSERYVTINGGQPASNWATHVAMTTYWYVTNSSAQNVAAGNAYVAAVGDAAKLAVATDYLNTAYLDTGVSVPSESIPYLFDRMDLVQAFCTTNSLTMTFYEGGFGTDDYEGGVGSNHYILHTAAKNVDVLYDQTMLVYETAYSKGGECPSLYLMAGTSGYSALSPDIYDTSPTWDAITDFNNEVTPEPAAPTSRPRIRLR